MVDKHAISPWNQQDKTPGQLTEDRADLSAIGNWSASDAHRQQTEGDRRRRVCCGASLRHVAHGVGVASTIGTGRIVRIDSSEAEKMPGVLAVLHHGNMAHLYRPAGALAEQSRPGESRPPFEDENVYYYGQFVALVIAETLEQAQ